VMMDAKWSIERELKAAKQSNDPDTAKIEARLDQAEANRKAAVQMQTQKSTQIALD
jgi:Spy/CpxP family protein refolding chaperone